MVIVFVHDGARSLVDFEIFPKPTGNHHLPFYSERHSVGFRCWIHTSQYYCWFKVSQQYFCWKLCSDVSLVSRSWLASCSRSPLRASPGLTRPSENLEQGCIYTLHRLPVKNMALIFALIPIESLSTECHLIFNQI